jgi:hypothetical protein
VPSEQMGTEAFRMVGRQHGSQSGNGIMGIWNKDRSNDLCTGALLQRIVFS